MPPYAVLVETVRSITPSTLPLALTFFQSTFPCQRDTSIIILSAIVLLLPIMGIPPHGLTGQLNIFQLFLARNAAQLVELRVLSVDDIKQHVQRGGQQVDQLKFQHTARP